MKQGRIGILWLIGWMSILCILLSGCQGTTPGNPEEPDPPSSEETEIVLAQGGKSDYVVVRPETAGVPLQTAASLLCRGGEMVGGGNLTLVTDAEPASEREILIGGTDRPESEAAMAEIPEGQMYRICVKGKKLVIVGRDERATAEAVRIFLRDSIGYFSALDYTARTEIRLPISYELTGGSSSMTVRDPRNPKDVVVVTAHAWDYGAVGDGQTDDTKAIQRAIDEVNRQGGGTVYLPAGQYLVKGALKITRSVYLVGEWENPDIAPDAMHKGTVLLATGGRGRTDGAPLMTVGASAGVIGLTVYYPEQSASLPVAYPPAILLQDAFEGKGPQHAASVQNVTIVNACRGIAADRGCQLPTVREVYLSALDWGLQVNECYDCARVASLHIAADYWERYERQEEGAYRAALAAGATGIILLRTDGQMMTDVTIRDCALGISLMRNPNSAGETAGYTSLSGLVLERSGAGIRMEYNSFQLSEATIRVSGYPILVTSETQSAGSLRLYDCELSGESNACLKVEDGAQCVVSVQNSRFLQWGKSSFAVEADGGMVLLTGNSFEKKGEGSKAVFLGSGVRAATVTANAFDSALAATVESRMDPKTVVMETGNAESLPETVDFAVTIPLCPAPERQTVYNVRDYGAVGDGRADDTAAIEKALRAAGAAGGGIVYLPAGYYRTTGSLTIPSGVELRGIHEGLHVPTGEGSVLYVTDGMGDEEGLPFITMKEGSILRGVLFWYPEQAWNDVRAYPATVAIDGENCTVRNVSFGNSYRALIGLGDCAGHYLENLTGCALREGIVMEESSGAGIMMNVHFNLSLYTAVWGTRLSDASGSFGSGEMFTGLLGYLNGNLTAFRLGALQEETLLFVFNYRARYGMDFTGGFDGKVIGCAVDGSLCGIRVTGSYENGLNLLNFSDDIVPGETPEGNLAIYIDADPDSTIRFVSGGASSYNYVPDGLILLKSGHLVLDGFDARVSPTSGQGALRIRDGGTAQVSGMVFQHVGPLDAEGRFTMQESALDIRADAGAGLSLYSAIGRGYLNTKLSGGAEVPFCCYVASAD